MTTLGAMQVLGQRRSILPQRPIWPMSVAYSWNSCVPRSKLEKFLMMVSVSDVSGPFQFFQGGSGSLVGR
jgi:hypothetical protein